MREYVVSLTTIPDRVTNIHYTLETIIHQTIKPKKIILNIPYVYTARYEEAIIQNEILDELKNKYDIVINMINIDEGPISRLTGLFKFMEQFAENTYIILVDDDALYKSYAIKFFDNCVQDNNDIKVASYYVYQYKNIRVGQCCDCFFIKKTHITKFEEFYNKVRCIDRIQYHDDLVISFFFHINKINIYNILSPYKHIIYQDSINKSIKSLCNLKEDYSRIELNKYLYIKLNEIFNT